MLMCVAIAIGPTIGIAAQVTAVMMEPIKPTCGGNVGAIAIQGVAGAVASANHQRSIIKSSARPAAQGAVGAGVIDESRRTRKLLIVVGGAKGLTDVFLAEVNAKVV